MDSQDFRFFCFDEKDQNKIKAQDSKKLKKLVLEGFPEYGKSQQNTMLLHYFAAEGDLDMCTFLMANGFEIDKVDGDGYVPLMHAARNGQTELVKLFCNSNTMISSFSSHGVHLVELAIASGNISTVEFLLDLVELPEDLCLSCIALASAYGFKDILEFLLNEINPDINIRSENSGMTPLMLAVAGGHIGVVKTLLSHGAKIELKNSFGQNVIGIAGDLKNEKIQALLGHPIPTTPIYVQHFLFPDDCNIDLSPKCLQQFNSSKSSIPVKWLSVPDPYKKYQCQLPQLQSCEKVFGSPQKNFLISINSIPFKIKGQVGQHPLTPNVFVSPEIKKKDEKSPWRQKYKNFCLKPFRKRSKSHEFQKHYSVDKLDDKGSDNTLEYILKSEKLSNFWPIFSKEQVTLKIFLTMNEDDLLSIGIKKSSARYKILKVISHYKRIFSL